MTAATKGTSKEASQKRRTHKKSRLGCRNCKLRGVKCDESKPLCKKCKSFGVNCNYNSKAADLEICTSGSATGNLQNPGELSFSANLLVNSQSGPLIRPLKMCIVGPVDNFELDGPSFDRFRRFQEQAIMTMGTPRVSLIYKREISRLACIHPYLMHVVQTLTALQERYTSNTPGRQSAAEAYHWLRATALFNQKLSTKFRPIDRDPLWATAALLAVIATAMFDAKTTEEAWPLKTSSNTDLMWMKICGGKNAIWKLTNPLRPDSCFHALAAEFTQGFIHAAPPESTVQLIPHQFLELYGLDVNSTAENNPYHYAVHMLAPLLHLECTSSVIARFHAFIAHMSPEFRKLLEQKDPRALLLIAYWYAKVSHGQWWVSRRAILEFQATYIYLQRYHPHEETILALLEYPAKTCRATFSDGIAWETCSKSPVQLLY